MRPRDDRRAEDQLAAKLQRGLSAAGRSTDVRQQSARAFAAIALADRLPDHGESVLKPLIEQWWRGEIVKKLNAGAPAIPRDQTYAFWNCCMRCATT